MDILINWIFSSRVVEWHMLIGASINYFCFFFDFIFYFSEACFGASSY